MTSERSARVWLKKFSNGSFADDGASEGGTSGGTSGSDGSTQAARSAPADDLEGRSQAELVRRLTAARIRLTEKDTAIRTLQEKQAEVEGRIRDGHLVESALVKRVGTDRAVALRNKLMELPAQWALPLAAITDPALVAEFTRKRIKQALNDFCNALGGPHQTDDPSAPRAPVRD